MLKSSSSNPSSEPVREDPFGDFRGLYETVKTALEDYNTEDDLELSLKNLFTNLNMFSGRYRDSASESAYFSFINELYRIYVRKAMPERVIDSLFSESIDYAIRRNNKRINSKALPKTMSGFKAWFGIED